MRPLNIALKKCSRQAENWASVAHEKCLRRAEKWTSVSPCSMGNLQRLKMVLDRAKSTIASETFTDYDK
jgi:hypothetical protein